MKKVLLALLKIVKFILGNSIFLIIFEFGLNNYLGKPQSFTFIYNGNEIEVTESSYEELLKENNSLKTQTTALQEELTELEKQFDENKSQETITKAVQEATAYWNNSDYIQALTCLKNCGVDADEILSLYKQFSDEYCLMVLSRSEELIENRQYDEAKAVLVEAKPIVVDTTVLDNKLNEINNNMPTKLSKIKISTSRFFNINENRPLEDTVGNRYSTGNLFTIRAEGDTGYGYATFYLGGKYTGLTGTIAVSDESENRSDVQLKGWVEIYSKTGDEYTLLYTSPVLSRMMGPVTSPEIGLEGAEWLEIRYYNNENYFSLAKGYHSLDIILSDFMIYSD